MNRKRVVVVCPGRGSYTRETSNYLSNPLADMDEYIKIFDRKRADEHLIKISELDQIAVVDPIPLQLDRDLS